MAFSSSPPAPPSVGGTGPVESPSGKSAATENFPVGSVLLSARVRPHVACYYAFARAIDDIADAPALSGADKIARLDGFEAAILGRMGPDPAFAKAHALRESLAATGVPARHATDLVEAFRRDARRNRTHSWDDLMDYCALSAAPVGRYLIALHGGSRSGGVEASDALCAALQVINHLQDAADDYRDLDRVYLPADWMAEAGARVEDLALPAATPAVRAVMDRCLEGCDRLMDRARALPWDIRDGRLALEAAVIVEIALALIARLRRQDPLAVRVKLDKPALIGCAVRGLARGTWALVRSRFRKETPQEARP
ncbi:squalene synthase HpnC [Pararhodospirillum oryzae]|uniref:Squalene synthase HpnC n=1 Tax=Pararhodospirillum oryzae TaxID=478448 RepID=A0A512H9K2_9PROT|nr:squalene synthase HpnC [Pararhodospirillum oryzae]GEO82136.1 squalene synthase HpnC [Pararhodospirillum oryzae]